mmetsp:Transcript_17571/g.30761  ORF Transcript_17571/g.30761 Transcript_17571/m.30761 type:complete len:299 (+) Transcript_17571:494-1390(+)
MLHGRRRRTRSATSRSGMSLIARRCCHVGNALWISTPFSLAYFQGLLLWCHPGVWLQIDDDPTRTIHRKHRCWKPILMRVRMVFNEIALLEGSGGSWAWNCGLHRVWSHLRGWSQGCGLSSDFSIPWGHLCLIQHLPHYCLNFWPFQDVICGRSLAWVSVQHLRTERASELRVGLGHHWHWSTHDFLHQAGNVWRIEWHFHGAEFVEDAAHSPDVRWPGIWLFLTDFWAKVVRRANLRTSASYGARENFGNTEVAHLQATTLREEEVPRLQVSVQNVPVMDVLQRQDSLSEPPQHLIL